MRRGEVWWAEWPMPVGHRPVVLLSRNEAYVIRSYVTVAKITTRVRGIPAEVKLDKSDGLLKPCVANLDSVTTISKYKLKRRIAPLKPKRIAQINIALKFALGL